jgi:TP901 family phage tail tape measure protein
MGGIERTVTIRFEGEGDDLLGVFGKIGEAAEGLTEALKKQQGEYEATTAKGVAAGTLIADAIQAGAEKAKQAAAEILERYSSVQFAIAKISTIAPEIDSSGLEKDLRRISTTVGKTQTEVAEGLFNIFGSLDVSQRQAVQLVELYSKGSLAAQTQTEKFGAAVNGVLNAYKLDVSEATRVSDVFFNTVNLGVITGEQLASGLGKVTPAAKSAGVSIELLGGLIAAVTKEGGQAEDSITNLSNFLTKFVGKDAREALSNLGVEVADKATGQFRPLLQVLDELQKKLAGLSESDRALAVAKIFPDDEAQKGFKVLLSQLEFVKRAFAENQKAAGATEEAYGKLANTFNAETQRAGAQAGALAVAIGKVVLESKPAQATLGAVAQVLKLLTDNVGATIALTTAVGALALAYTLLNTAAIPNAVSSFGTLVSTLRLVGQVMVGTASLVQGSAATIAVATLGWGALALAIGAATFTIYKYVTAETEFAGTTVETIRAAAAKQKQLEALNIATLDYAEKTEGCTGTLIDLKAAYDALSPAAQARVSAIRGEAERLAALREELFKAKEEAKQLAQLQGFNTLGAFGQAIERQNAALKERQELLAAFNKENERAAAGTDTLFGFNVAEFNKRNLLESSSKASAAYEEQQKKIEELIPRVVELQKAFGLSDEELLKQITTYGLVSQDAIPRVREALDNYRNAQRSAAGATKTLTERIKEQVSELEKAAAADRQSIRRKAINEAVAEAAEGSKTTAEAFAKVQEARKGDLGKIIDDYRRTGKILSEVNESLDLDPKKKTSRGIVTLGDQVQQVTREIAKAKREVDALKAGGGRLFDLTLQKEDVEEEKRRLEEILKLRRALGVQQQAALPATREGQEALLRGLQRENELRQNVLKLSEEQADAQARLRLAYAASTAAVVDAQTKADIAYLEGLRKRREAYADTVADLANLIRRQRDEERGLGDALIQAQVSVFRENLDAGARVQREGFEAVSRLLLAQGDVFRENPILRQAVAIANRPPQVSPVVERLNTTNELLKGIDARLEAFSSKPNDGAAAMAFRAGRNRSTGSSRIDGLVDRYSAQYGVDPNLIVEVMRQESGFKQGARSNAGAIGLMQLLPGTASMLGVNPQNLEQNVKGGVKYLAQLLEQFEGDVRLALAGYNAGPGRAFRALRGFKETREYVANITGRLGRTDAAQPEPEPQGFFERAFNFGRQFFGSAGASISNTVSTLFSSRNSTTPVDDPRATAAAFRTLLGAIGLGSGSDAEVNARGRALQSLPDGQRQLADAAAILNNRTQIFSIENQIAELRAGKGAAAAKLLSDAETQRATALRDSIAAAQSAEERLARLRAGDPAAVETARNNANAAITNSQIQTAERIIGLQEEIARAGEGAAERMKLAYLESVRARQTAEESAAASIIRSQVELADKGVFSQTQATAKVLDYLNRNTKSVSEIVADLRINTFDGLFKVIDGGLDRVTRKLGFAGSILKQFLSDLTRNVLSRFLGLGGGAGGSGGFGIPGFGGGVTGTPGFAGGSGGGIAGGLLQLLGGGGGGGFGIPGLGSVTGTPGFSGGGGFVGSIRSLLTGGGGGFGILGLGGVTGTPGFNGSTLSQQAAQALLIGPGSARQNIGATGVLNQALGGLLGRGGIGSGQFSALGLLKGFGPALPLLGLGLGGRVGGVLGAVGGGLLGLSGAAALGAFGSLGAGAATIGGIGTVGLGGGVAALFTNPFTILAGVGLLIGGFLLGRARQRGRDERERDRLFGEAQKQLQQLLDDVNRDRVDGGSAIQQARQIRDEYQKAVNGLKTGSVRRSAQTTGRRGEPSQFSIVDGLVKRIEEATDSQNRRREIDQKLVPEFDGGGVVGSQRMAKILAANGIGLRGFTGMLPGAYRGRGFDTIPIVAQGGELVLNPRQQRALDLTPAKLAAAGVPNFNGAPAPQVEYAAGGGVQPSGVLGGFTGAGGLQIFLQLVMGTDTASKLLVLGARTREGQEVMAKAGLITAFNGGF